MKNAGLIVLVIGIVLGAAGGLYYAWSVNPVEYIDSAPASLRADFRDDYIALIASAFGATNDLDRARIRLAMLQVSDPARTLSMLAQSRLAEGHSEFEVRALAQLAAALGDRPSSLAFTPTTAPPGATPENLTPTVPPATSTIQPTRTPTATPGAPFEPIEQEEVCEPRPSEPLIQVMVLDADGAGVPGMAILVIWDSGQDRFFTGLKPELGMGYADFMMTPGVVYSLQVSDADRIITGLVAPECTDGSGETYPGSWSIIYQQPARPD
jgi:hypothetical protein